MGQAFLRCSTPGCPAAPPVRAGTDGHRSLRTSILQQFTAECQACPICKDARFYLADVSAGGDLPADEAILNIPPAGSDTVTLDAATQAKLAATGWVNFMSLITR